MNMVIDIKIVQTFSVQSGCEVGKKGSTRAWCKTYKYPQESPKLSVDLHWVWMCVV